MGKGQRLLRRAATVKIGALVAVVLLVLALPTLAFAANTATFSGRTPAGFSAGKPTVSVVVYDRYGVKGSANYSLYVDGVKKSAKISYYAGYGYKKFKLSFAVPTALSNGSHTVLVKVKDTKSLNSSYTWKFTADTVAPVTVTSPVSLPQFLKNPTAFASDNVQFLVTETGSGLAKTFYQVDGGPVTQGTFAPYLFGAGAHTIRYWSVDNVGNVEAAKTLSTTLQWEHGLPLNPLDAGCLLTGCHGGAANVQVIHAGLGVNSCTLSCHLGSITATNDCVACHSTGGSVGAPANHATHVVIDSSATAGSATDCTNSACHGSSYITLHGGCAGCHNPQAVKDMPDPALVNTVIASGVAGSLASCESCHTSMTSAHAPGNTAHTKSGACFTSTCHGTDVTKMHANDFRGTGDNPPGCAACHAPGRTPTTSCGACHPDLVTPHDYTAAHTSLTTSLSSKSAVCKSCHGTDLTKVALVDPGTSGVPTSPTGFDEHKGCSCHAYFEARGKTSCQDCHGQPGDTSAKYPYHVDYHNTLVSNLNDSPAAACTACHGNDVLHVGSRTTATGTVNVPANTTDAVQEHTNCSCHIYGEVKLGAKQVCTDCHDGAYGAIHGWDVVSSTRSPETLNVSGHNTTAFGTVGARTTFTDLGITDTQNNTPTVTMPLTTNNTFKAGVLDSTGQQMGWNSVITCEDCHTGLVGKEVAGPHGGSTVTNWGIDPAYTGSFESASLWGGKYSQGLADGTTYTVGPFNSGIAQWANTSSDPEGLAGYQVVTPDMSTASSKKLVIGPATVTNGNVICVKCHDLYDETKTTGFKGWGNYPHEHHSADTGSFKMYFGKYAVQVDGTNAGTYTVSAESMTAAKTAVTADHGGSVVASSEVLAAGLGREDAGACRNCHIAIPHGWKRPKLIVYSNLNPNDPQRAALGLPATGDSAPYNIGPAVYEGEGLFGTAIGSGQMNGLASGPVVFKEATHLLSGQVATIGSDPSQLLVETYNYPSLYENENPANGTEFVNWSSAQCNACGHHVTTSFVNPTATQPAMTWNSRESNWTSTKPANGAWK